ncbi:Hsp20/alpha crystallin family protein [Planktothrix sp. FACHB-1365]|uniref:Hsp20/alpha crystallin family protein n=1 Tax=Planktothrix sp. FACHB-1365 TaxID=2692855 RepID=UPI0016880435|nr:Hsp20/alpha crystallin family protein [Planktothrix sp. FACHB-1365]MBD2480482.1 Hsp20/alpha crystallin family protein [Planktothrix sp. FACHB-1365]
MPLVRWQPFQEIDSLQREMNRLFDSLALPTEKMGMSIFPPAELHETPDAVILKLEVPGIDSKDLDIQVSADAVAITGERKSQIQTEEKGVTRSEFHYGKFHRVIPLPTRIQNTQVQADYQDGILSLTLPKAEEEKNKVVKVTLN